MKKMTTRKLCINALLIALVCVATMFLQIPVPATSGYIHLGDSIILIAGIFFGWEYGLIAGGIGSALADLLTGYPHWMFFTLIIKGLMGLLVGKAANFHGDGSSIFSIRNITAVLLAEVWMVLGYLIGGTILKSSFIVAVGSVPSNIVQGIGGIVIYFVVGLALEKGKVYRICRESEV